MPKCKYKFIQFYEILGEDFEKHVQDCSRHRAEEDPNSTPKVNS
jgi:hypothetical protein